MQTLKYVIGADHRALVKDVQDFKIDFSGVKNWLQARQYEDGMRQVFVNVVNEDGTPFDLTGCNIMFEGLLPDGTHRIMDAKHSVIIDPTNGQFRFDFPKQAFSLAGSYKQAFFRIMRNGSSVTTLEFSLEVLADKVISGIVPSDYLTPFEDLYAKLSDILANADGEVKAKLLEWQNQINELITNLNGDYATIQATINLIKESLTSLEDKIKEDGLLTQADLDNQFDNFSKQIENGLNAIDELNNDVIDSGDIDGGIPQYMRTTLSIARAQLDKSLFNVGFGTDYHYDIATNYNPHGSNYTPPANMQELWQSGLRKSLNILDLTDTLDAVVFGGDNTDQPAVGTPIEERQIMIKEQQDFARTVFTESKSPAFILKGNHDNNNDHAKDDLTLANAISDADFAELYRQKDTLYGEKRQNNGNYFYKDFADKKIRLIGLDAYDVPETANADGTLVFNRFKTSGFQQAQIDWLANDALQVPSGYTAIIFLHAPINNTLLSGSASGSINHDIVKQILEDYVSGASDMSLTGKDTTVPVSVKYSFNGNKGLLAAVVSGHLHLDGNVVVNGINYVQTRCSLTAGDNVIKDKRWGYYGTALEDAFDLISIDGANRKIKFYRVGAGSEDVNYATRQFNY